MSYAIKNLLNLCVKNNVVVPQVRFYPRWRHRTPAKVYAPEEYEEMEKRVEGNKNKKQLIDKYQEFKPSWNKAKTEEEHKSKAVEYKVKTKKVKKPLIATSQKVEVKRAVDMLETAIDEENNFIYTKMKDNDSRVGSILATVKSSKEQEKKELLLLEGKRLIKDAILSGCTLKYIFFSRKDDIEYLKPILPKMGFQLYKMPYREMQMWSDLTTTPGIMGIFKRPDVELYTPKESVPLTVICDNIREPGNLGTILRICAAVGCDKVILTKGCVNLWDSKVLRSSTGAHFKLQIHSGKNWDEINKIVGENSDFFIADNKIVSDSNSNGDDLGEVVSTIPVLPYYGLQFHTNKHVVLIVGGETLGVSRDSYDLALKTSGVRLNIPLCNDVDSLNVGAALGVIAFEIKKQLTVASSK